jgi:hypothetical protein
MNSIDAPDVMRLEKSTSYCNKNGHAKEYYFENNPWKSPNRLNRIFRYCVICGENRFQGESWEKSFKGFHKSPLVCERVSCQLNIEFLPNYVPKECYLLINQDKTQGSHQPLQTLPCAAENNKDEMQAVKKKVKVLEKAFFIIAEWNNIKPVGFMSHTKDPHLKAIATCRDGLIDAYGLQNPSKSKL